MLHKAIESDLDNIFEIYQGSIKEMHSRGVFQWGDFYPTKDILAEDIYLGELYKAVSHGEILAITAINSEQSPEYGQGYWLYGENFMCIHRLCVTASYMGQGIGKQSMRLIEDFAAKCGAHSIRLDTLTQNEAAMRLYSAMGYEKRGLVRFPYRTGYYCLFEKSIEKLAKML
ncbi:MAG: GNAT family N-acetyltransferase [Eubacteriaceae bacterium]|nr:GNAT family N-acetyltransferase [Eubacteriaceae bacterium]